MSPATSLASQTAWLAIDCREDSVAGAGGRFVRGHVVGPAAARSCRVDIVPISLADRQRPGFLRRLHRAILLSGGAGGVLSVSGRRLADLEGCRRRGGAGRHFRCGALLAWRRLPYLFVGWFWYVGMLVPVIGLVQVGSQAMADRYTYLPQIGLCIAVAWGRRGASPSLGRYRRWAYGVASVLLMVGLMACAWRQTSFWQNSETLWTHALACTSAQRLRPQQSGRGLGQPQRGGRGHRPFPEGDGAGADFCDVLCRTWARPWMPADNRTRRPTPIVKAELSPLHRGDRPLSARRWKLKPELLDLFALQSRQRPGRLRTDRGGGRRVSKGVEDPARLCACPQQSCQHSADQGRNDEAIAEYRKAIALKPNYADARNNLGTILAESRRTRRRDRAISHGVEDQAHVSRAPTAISAWR